jgi:alpha-N-arabinofuranosidase
MQLPASRNRRLSRREFMQQMSVAGLSLAGGRALSEPASFAQAPGEPLAAKLSIDLERQLGTINPNLFGSFIEHIGRCVYGGVYEEGSNLADAGGFRRDVLEAARKLHITQLRWPGGNFSSGYHWQDGIGPKENRPARYNVAWFQPETNHFGTDEFISYCRKLGAEPYICVNVGDGTVDEAMYWVEYCNRPGGTYFSDLRRKQGHAEPYRVKYWSLGNEIYGDWQIGHKEVREYAATAVEMAKVMKWMDPSICLIACGAGDYDPAWDRSVLEALVPHIDCISVHHYTVTDDRPNSADDFTIRSGVPQKDYYEILGGAAQMESNIRASARLAETVSQKAHKSPPVGVAVDEWNIVNNFSDWLKRDDVHKHEADKNLRDALWVASALNTLERNCRTVRLANHSMLVNVLAPIFTSPTGMLLRTIYFPLELYATRSGPTALDVSVEAPRFETKSFGSLMYLDASATYDPEKRRVTLAVVNRRKEGDVVGTIDLSGVRAKPGGRAFLITGSHPDARNTFENPRAVCTQEVELSASGGRWEHLFPRHSISWLEFDAQL